MISEAAVRDALKSVKYPGFSRDIVSFGLVKKVAIHGDDVTIQIALTTAEPSIARIIKESSEKALRDAGVLGRTNILIDIQAPAHPQSPVGPQSIPGVRSVIAVASGKGGVGKSTVAANLALALAADGPAVGLCDCDIYGPSIALMFGTKDRPLADENNQILPVQCHGIKMMSMGLLLDDGSPAVLRGPMVTRYTQQLLRQVAWAPLDILVLDLPPGTGDIQLTIVQTVALAGAIIVTTPQEVALIDARKAIGMFAKTNVPVLGIVENMSYFLCPSDQTKYHIFGEGGGEREARRFNTELLGRIPIEINLREAGDRGIPAILSHPESPASLEFQSISKKILSKI